MQLWGGVGRPDGTPSSSLAEDVAATCRSIAFLRLKVLGSEAGDNPEEAFVSFQVRPALPGLHNT